MAIEAVDAAPLLDAPAAALLDVEGTADMEAEVLAPASWDVPLDWARYLLTKLSLSSRIRRYLAVTLFLAASAMAVAVELSSSVS